MYFYAFLAFLPILLAFILMVILRWSSMKALPLSFLVTALSAYFVWDLSLVQISAFTVQGIFSAMTILLIIFGALLIYYNLLASGAMETIQAGLQGISKDQRVQALIIGFMFVTFIEGIAGVGTPPALAAPLLVGLGFPALCAAVICFMFNAVAVVFGGVGMVITKGYASIESLAMLELATNDPFTVFRVISEYSALINLPMIYINPLLILAFMTWKFAKNKEHRSFKAGLALWKYSFLASTCFAIPYVTMAYLTGPELPSLTGGLIGLALLVFFTKKGIFLPKDIWTFETGLIRENELSTRREKPEIKEYKMHMSQFRAWLPYSICALMLIILRVPYFEVRPHLLHPFFSFSLTDIFDVENASISIPLLDSPGILPFLLVSILIIFLHKMYKDDEIGSNKVFIAWKNTLRSIKAPAVAVSCAVALVAIFSGSAVTQAVVDAEGNGLSMPMTMARAMAHLTSSSWPYFAPYFAGIVTFITGSGTVCNMLLADFQWNMAKTLGFEQMQYFILLAVQAAGATVGSMISIQGIVSVCTVLGILGQEGIILRICFLAFLLCASAVSLFTYFLL